MLEADKSPFEKKIRIAFILPSIRPEAPIKVTKSIVEGLVNSGFEHITLRHLYNTQAY